MDGDLQRACWPDRSRGCRLESPRRRSRQAARILSAQHAVASDPVLRRAETGWASGAHFAARCRTRYRPQTARYRCAHPGHDRRWRDAGRGAETGGRPWSRWADRQGDHRRGRLLARGRERRAHLGNGPAGVGHRLARCRALARVGVPAGGAIRCRADAVHGRHHGAAQGRAADASQPVLGHRDLSRLGRAAGHVEERRRQGAVRAAAVPHLRALGGDAVHVPERRRADPASALRY